MAGAGAVRQQTPVFRSRIDLARLDVTVIDNKTGNPALDGKYRKVSVKVNRRDIQVDATAVEIPLTGQASIVKVLVYDCGADLLGCRTVKLR